MKILFLFLTLISYQIQSDENLITSGARQIELAPHGLQQIDSIEVLWSLIVFEQGGCLGGGQYVSDNMSMYDEMSPSYNPLVFSSDNWKKLAKQDTSRLTDFLIGILSDTNETKVHTCPFSGATNGEMAVYALQHIHSKNWYDFSEFIEFRDKEKESAIEQPQAWLQAILMDEGKRKKLAELFKNELRN